MKGVKLQSLRRHYELLQMGKNERVADYASKIQVLVHMMKDYGEVMTEKLVIEKVTSTLTPQFDRDSCYTRIY